MDNSTVCIEGITLSKIKITTTTTNPAPQGDGNDCRGDKIEQDTCGKNINYLVLNWLADLW